MLSYPSLTSVQSRRTTVFFLLWALALSSLSAGDPFQESTVKSVFDEIDPSLDTLVDQILEIERQVCNERDADFLCSKCYNDSLCAVYHDCCPDLILQENIIYEEQFLECQPLIPFSIYQSYQRRMMVSHCPITDTSGPGVKGLASSLLDYDVRRCEDPDVTILNQSVPVSSDSTGLVYRNQFCAACHGEMTNFTMWKSSVHCNSTPAKLVSMSKTKLEMFQILMSRTGVDAVGCELRFIPPAGSRLCYPKSQEIISSCNVSGQWDLFDIRLEQACHMYTSVFNNSYKNMFCYLCNQLGGISLSRLMKNNIVAIAMKPTDVAWVSYRALLDFHENTPPPENRPSISGCSQNQFYDTVDCICRTPLCSPGKSLTADGRCQSMLNSNFLGYRLCAQMVLESDLPLEDSWNASFLFLYNFTALDVLTVSVTEWCPGDQRIVLDLVSKISSDKNGPKEGFSTLEHLESEIQEVFFGNQTIFSEASSVPWNVVQFKLVKPCPQMPTESFPCFQNKSIKLGSILQQRMTAIEVDQSQMYFIDYTKVTSCAFVSMPLASLSLEAESQRYVYPVTSNSISVADVHIVNESEVWICRSDYKLLTLTDNLTCISNTDSKTSHFTWTVPGLISLVCTCISLLCLFLTFLTYLSLPQLRSGGGENIITLIVTLFIAQALYEFLVEQHENQTLCIVFAIAIHYSWLAAVFSMNACTVERYLKLYYPIKSRVYFMSKKPYILATAYTFVSPLIIILVNIMANQLTQNSLGYGSPHLCYINTLISRIAAFAVPVGTVLLVNLFLLVISICTVNSNSNQELGFKSHCTLDLVACVRLSSVTGFTWLLLFVLEAFPHPVLEYIISALFGLQGALFIFSLIINKRTMSLLCTTYPVFRRCAGLFGCRQVCCSKSVQSRTPTTTSGTQSSLLIHSNDQTLTDMDNINGLSVKRNDCLVMINDKVQGNETKTMFNRSTNRLTSDL